MARPASLVQEMLAAIRSAQGEGARLLDLQQDVSSLESALGWVADTVAAGGRVLFVGTAPAAKGAVTAVANRSVQYYRWRPDTLSNRRSLGEPVAGGPNILIVVDPKSEDQAIRKANAEGIPVVAIASDVNEGDEIKYQVYGDVTAGEFVSLYCNLFANAAFVGIGAKSDNLVNFDKLIVEHFAGDLPGFEFFPPSVWLESEYKGLKLLGRSDIQNAGQGVPDQFSASAELVDLVYRGLHAHYEVLGAAHKQLLPPSREEAEALLTPRIFELFASWARRMRHGALPKKPILSDGRFDYQFILELDDNVPIRIDDGTLFFDRLRDELLDYLTRGGRIRGNWGRATLIGSRIELEPSEPVARGTPDWQKPDRIDVR
jgi:small subunit ribosomal protein S2